MYLGTDELFVQEKTHEIDVNRVHKDDHLALLSGYYLAEMSPSAYIHTSPGLALW